MGRAMTGILHLLNQTLIHWFSKKQNTVEKATYGSEFVAAKQATEQIMDLRYTLRMLGVPIDGPAWMFGDNQSVVTSATIPHSSLNKRHNALAYHRVREAIAAKVLYFKHVSGKNNVGDIFTKFLAWPEYWPLVQPLLFWKGETLQKIDQVLPLNEVVEVLKEESHSGLRGVTHGNEDQGVIGNSFPCLLSPSHDSIKESPRQDSEIGNALVNTVTHHLLTNEMPERKVDYSAYMLEEKEDCLAYMSEEQKRYQGCLAYKDEDTSGTERLSATSIMMASEMVSDKGVTFKDIIRMVSDKEVTDGITAEVLENESESPEKESNHGFDELGKVG
jgi:predicted DNA binding CopG/RHH family protein